MSLRPLLLLLLLTASAAHAKPDGTSTMPAKRLSDFDAGKRLWKQSCWQCHGPTGHGDGPAAGALAGGVPPLVLRGEDFDALIRVIQDGRGKMPAYSENIDEHESRRILGYIRDVMAGKGPPPPERDEDDGEGAEEGQ